MLGFAAILVALAVIVGWVLALIGMPGSWVIVAVTAGYAWLFPNEGTLSLGWPTVAGLAALALGGELWELASGSLWAAGAGASRRGITLALVGATVGGLVGAIVGLPIPVIGWLLGAILLAALGAMAGAILGEFWYGRPAGEIWKLGKAAFWGRLFGTVGKLFITSLMAAIALIGLVR